LGAHGRSGTISIIPGDEKLYQRQIETTDEGIDALVYELYGLTEEEIAIVKGARSLRIPNAPITPNEGSVIFGFQPLQRCDRGRRGRTKTWHFPCATGHQATNRCLVPVSARRASARVIARSVHVGRLWRDCRVRDGVGRAKMRPYPALT